MMDVTEIRNYLPHRYPFLLVDRVLELNLGESIVAYKTCPSMSPFSMVISRISPFSPGCCWSKRWLRPQAYWALNR